MVPSYPVIYLYGWKHTCSANILLRFPWYNIPTIGNWVKNNKTNKILVVKGLDRIGLSCSSTLWSLGLESATTVAASASGSSRSAWSVIQCGASSRWVGVVVVILVVDDGIGIAICSILLFGFRITAVSGAFLVQESDRVAQCGWVRAGFGGVVGVKVV